jgi:hypothetical protein
MEKANPYGELKRFMCERSSGLSHVEDGAGDTHRPKQSNHWLFREQLEIQQRESAFEIKRREQKRRWRDLKPYLSQDWRFARILYQVQHMNPGRNLDRVIEDFWI